MQQRRLGSSGLEVSAIGLGCMTLTGGYSGMPDRQDAVTLLHRAWTRHVLRHREITSARHEELVGEESPYDRVVTPPSSPKTSTRSSASLEGGCCVLRTSPEPSTAPYGDSGWT
jgi:hypothetical protein